MLITLEKTDPEFWWNPAGIPAWTFPDFQVDSGWIPLEFRRNPPELLPAFRRYSPGILDISSRNSAGLLPAFHWNFSRNSAGIIAGIPPVFH